MQPDGTTRDNTPGTQEYSGTELKQNGESGHPSCGVCRQPIEQPERAGEFEDEPVHAEYITCVISDQGEFGEDYTHSVTARTSVYPHADLAEMFTATGHAFKPGWE